MKRKEKCTPAGGYVLIGLVQLCMAWRLYREKHIRARDLRVFCALVEMRERRRGSKRSRLTAREVRGLTGGLVGEVRGSLRRLVRSGLVRGGPGGVEFATNEVDLSVSLDGIAAMLAAMPKRARVNIPRRMLRLLAGGRGGALLATALGHLIRCLRFEGGELVPEGNCPARWVAETFGVSERQVRAARARLVELQILTPVIAPQWHRNAYGGRYRVNVAWSRAGGSVASEALPRAIPAPRPARIEAIPAGPESKENPPSERKNQKPSGPEGAGALHKKGKDPASTKPRWGDLTEADLRSTGRLMTLLAEVRRRGVVGNSESDQLWFVSAAEHALAYGSRNRPGLFRFLVERRLGSFITQDDEERARVRIRRHLFGDDPKREPQRRARPTMREWVDALSSEGKLVLAVRRAATRTGYRGDSFLLAKHAETTLTREAWERGIAELSMRGSMAA